MPALLFDLYGVLMLEQTPSQLAAIEEAAGQGGPAFWDAYWQCRAPFDAGLVDADGYWDEVEARTGSRITDRERLVEADYASWRDADEEMVSYVTSLARDGHRIGILSNIPVDLAERISSGHPWIHEFDPVVMSGHIGVAKPEAGAFQHAVAAFGLNPGEILFVDDRQPNIDGAVAAGLKAHRFTGITDLRPVIAAHLSCPA